jgi:6-phosphogluconolactonase
MKKIVVALVCFFSIITTARCQLPANEHYMLVGTYTTGKSKGIYVYKFNSTNGAVTPVGMIATSNPSYVAISPDKKHVYAVHENARNGNGGEVAAFSFNNATGNLSFINQEQTAGDHPCYVTVDQTGKWVLAGNYTSGSLSVLPVKEDGSLGAAVTIIRHEGRGINQQRQEGPHVHETVLSADNRWLFVPDLGTDKVMIYAFNDSSGSLTAGPQPFAKSKDGSGPRHVTFAPNNQYAYLVQELSGKVVAFKYHDGHLKRIQEISALPRGFKGAIGSAELQASPDGRFLYVSNRGGSNNIAIFHINPRNGKLSVAGYQSTMGEVPRYFNFDPTANFLLAANQESNNIVIFKRDAVTGLLTDTGKRVDVGNPVCIGWID